MIDERDYDIWDQPRITWHVKYQRPLLDHASVSSSSQADQASSLNIATTAIDGRRSETTSTFVESNEGHHNTKDSYRLRAKVSVKKDEVQAVLPIAKHKDLMNLAVLTGRQVSRPLKIFIVSQAGDVADVTLHSSCSSSDQSVLKVMHPFNWITQIPLLYIFDFQASFSFRAEKKGETIDFICPFKNVAWESLSWDVLKAFDISSWHVYKHFTFFLQFFGDL